MSEGFVVIVDGYSAGNLLAPEFNRRGYECIHLQSTPEIWPILLPSFRREDYAQNLAFQGNLEALLKILKPLKPAAVIPGTETGVELADTLSERLGLAGNGTAKSAARRDKYEMIETARSHGLLVAEQLLSRSALEIIVWKRKLKLSKIVIKPVHSAGTDNVFICQRDQEIHEACETIVGSTNKLGLTNTHALAQEFLFGTEFFLNTVSHKGKHHFTEIWQYKKRSINGHDCVYDRNELLPFEGQPSKALRDYVLEVLAALQIKEGPAHTEVMLTPKGPALVEIGTRLDGLTVPSVNQAAVGYSAVELTVDAIVNEKEFSKKTQMPFPLLKHALTVYLTSYQEGVVRAIPGEEKIRALPSFFQMRLRMKPGSQLVKTTNYFTAPGFLTLVHEDKQVLMSDYETIRKLEQGNLFELE